MAKTKAKKLKGEQICTVCKEQKPITAFYRDGTSKSGPRYRKDCKDCYKKRRDANELAKTLPGVIAMTPVKHIGDDDK